METISFRFFPGESNYRSDQTSEGYRNGCDCRQASGHANGSLVAPLRTRSTPMKRARTERSLTNDRKQEEDEKKGVSTLWAIFSDREYLSNSNVIMAMAIKCLSSRQHQHKEFLYGSIPESRQSYPLAESICMLNQQRSSNLPQETLLKVSLLPIK
ncbi:hypothetical protein V1477_002618 [Vespula maculifrons]|uniref:Uncharacterized protein n=1 Tax=Vespula maculifrons TaxID=7453 RepID=A0ABD2CV39_VESMC